MKVIFLSKFSPHEKWSLDVDSLQIGLIISTKFDDESQEGYIVMTSHFLNICWNEILELPPSVGGESRDDSKKIQIEIATGI